jgi:hypothetical protein
MAITAVNTGGAASLQVQQQDQAQQAKAAQDAEKTRQAEQARAAQAQPVVNQQGQTTGTVINTTA